MLNWFRTKIRSTAEQAPPPAAAPTAPPPAERRAEAGATEETKKRRRGSRGGRNRKKTTQPQGATSASNGDAPGAAAAKPAETKRERSKAERGDKAEPRGDRSRRRRVQQRRLPLPAAKRELLVSVDVGEQRVAVLEDDRVAEVYLERPERRSIAGNIYKGSVDNVLPGMEAAFVEIGLEKNGFLYVDEIVAPELEGRRHGRKIQELLSRGQELLVQAVKDPMKSKGARLTTEISLPGRFVVYVPHGEGIGVSRRLEDDERVRLRDILKGLELPEGGLIVRTAAEGASADDIERDVVFLQRLWKSIQARAKDAKAPALVYQEAELPLRVVRDLFTGDFERALVDEDRTYRRIVGYLKKTSPHMVERVVRHREKESLFGAFGVDGEIRSTLSRRVDLPSGGYLVFDYAEAFTVIDVNTGRFTGSRSKSSGSGLEETITKNNLEAVKEVVRQLRLRDIGGIIVIDFIDMANPKNRATVEEALRQELERDRTKTYVVEISPLGLVEMTRQNVTDGPREVMTKKCPTCGGDGIVVSEHTAAVEIERRLRALATPGSRTQAYRVEVNAKIAALVVGPAAQRLAEIEETAKRRFFLEGKEDVHLDHFHVLEQGSLAKLKPQTAIEEGAERELKLGEVGLHDARAGVGKLDGLDVHVAGAAKLVGKKVKVRIVRVMDGQAYGELLHPVERAEQPITAEGEAEKPTRAARTRKKDEAPEPLDEAPVGEVVEADAEVADEEEHQEQEEEAVADGEQPPKKKRTRRGTRGGRNRKKKPATGTIADAAEESEEADEDEAVAEPAEPDVAAEAGEEEEPQAPKIHVPDDSLGREDGEEAAPAKKRTRRGSRGGRRRKKPGVAAAAGADGAQPAEGNGEVAEANADDAETTEKWEYVPMSEWEEDVAGSA